MAYNSTVAVPYSFIIICIATGFLFGVAIGASFKEKSKQVVTNTEVQCEVTKDYYDKGKNMKIKETTIGKVVD